MMNWFKKQLNKWTEALESREKDNHFAWLQENRRRHRCDCCCKTPKGKLDPFDESTWSKEERFYFGYLDDLAESGVNETVSNCKAEHYLKIMCLLFESADRHVGISLANIQTSVPGDGCLAAI